MEKYWEEIITGEFKKEVLSFTEKWTHLKTPAGNLLYRISKVVIRENKTFLGSEQLLKENGVDVIIVNNAACIEMMEGFIKNNPELWNEDIGV